MTVPMRFEERVAKLVVESVIPGATMHFRLRQSNGEVDFDLELPSGVVVPLEVTTATDRTLNETLAAIKGTRKEGPFIQRTIAKYDWYVYPLATANIRRIRREIDRYLAEIEREERTSFFFFTDGPESTAVRAIFRDLRVEGGNVVVWNPPGRIGIASPGQGSRVSSRHVMNAVRQEAAKADNRRKLGAAGGSERHLFLYVDPNRYPVWRGLVDELPPSVAPVLPVEVTHVWVVTNSRVPGQFVVWRFAKAQGWSADATVQGTIEFGAD